MLRSGRLARFLPLAALVLGACVIAPYDQFHHQRGSVTFAWTLEGSSDPSLCELAGAPLVRIVVWDELDTVVNDDFVACWALGAQYVVSEGWYTASLALTDGSGADLDAASAVGQFYVGAGLDTFVPVDLALPAVFLAPVASPAPLRWHGSRM